MGEYSASVACLAEGSAEQAVMDILLDNDLLIFDRRDLIDEKVLRFRSAEKFEQRYLRKSFSGQITVYRILDSRPREFQDKQSISASGQSSQHHHCAGDRDVDHIEAENQYDAFKKSGQKPSEFCKGTLRYKNVKTYDFVKAYFSNPAVLTEAIRKYVSVSRIPKGGRNFAGSFAGLKIPTTNPTKCFKTT